MASAKRKLDETFVQYRARLRVQAQVDKAKARGRLLWNSIGMGPYVRSKYGELK